MSFKYTNHAARILLIAMSIVSIPAHAIVSVGVKGGASFVKWAQDPGSGTYSHKAGIMGGLGLKTMGPIGLLVDVLYAQRSPSNTKTSNIYIPVQMNFGVGPLMLTAGGFYQMGLSLQVAGASVDFASSTVAKTDYGVVAGIGFKLMSLSLEARYNIGFADLDTTSTYKTNSRSMDFLVGYWF